MPTYEYACRKCGKHLEVVQSFTDEPLTRCPSCRGQLRKVFGAIGISFKGSGFYKTDSRNNGGKVGAGKSAEKSGAEKAGSEKTGGDKPSAASGDKASGSGGGDKSSSAGSSTTAKAAAS